MTQIRILTLPLNSQISSKAKNIGFKISWNWSTFVRMDGVIWQVLCYIPTLAIKRNLGLLINNPKNEHNGI